MEEIEEIETLCVGVLLTLRTVLTSVSCMNNAVSSESIENLRVVAGKYYLPQLFVESINIL